jgi:WD40 repeat protein
MRLTVAGALALLLPALLSSSPAAQLPCGDVPPVPVTREPVAFTEQQEVDLGDAVAELFERDLRIVPDDRNKYLLAIGERLLRAMPATALKFSFVLVDDGDLNAFAIPGGRVYVSRKTVAFTRTEDELAGILAHEIGHIFTRQLAAEATRDFRETLGIRDFGDRADIFRKFGQLQQAGGVGRTRERGRDQQHQYEADRFALGAAVRAGYSADAYVALWDRYNATGGRTGNLFTDFFNTTGTASRRLREMTRALEALPAACRTARAPESADAFAAWRERVIADTRMTAAGREAATDEAATTKTLTPRLGTELHTLRFSPDGRWALAQDESAIYVLSREPFGVTARFDAFDAYPAQFTPDSRHIIIHTPELRVERWDVATGRRLAAHELVIRNGCLGLDVSASGEWLACVDNDMTLSVVDVARGEAIWKKERAFPSEMIVGGSLLLFDVPIYRDTRSMPFGVRFSPDDRYLVVSGPSKHVLLDLRDHVELRPPDTLRRALDRDFDFVGGDRILAVNRRQPDRSELLTFPAGEVVKTLTLGGSVKTATNPRYAVLRPIRDWPLGLMDLSTGQIVMAYRTTAFDVHGGEHLGEQAAGGVAIYPLDAPRPSATASLPDAALGRIRAAAASPDLRWLAISGRDRGAVWDLETGRRTAHVLGFTGASVDASGVLYADFPSRKTVTDGKTSERPRRIVKLEPAGRTSDHVVVEHPATSLDGPYYLTLIADPRNARNGLLEVRDTASSRLLWSRRLENGLPLVLLDSAANRVVMLWTLDAETARKEISDDSALRKAARGKGLRDGLGHYVETLDASTGRRVGHFLTDILLPTQVRASGNLVALFDRAGQVTVVDAASGERRGSTAGRAGLVSEEAGLLAVHDVSGRLDLYDLASVARVRSLRLPGLVRFARFSADGRRLLVVTADQTARVFDVARSTTPQSP